MKFNFGKKTTTEVLNNLTLHEKLIRECEAMANHALESGKPIPVDTMALVEEFTNKKPEEITNYAFKTRQLVGIHYELSKIIEPAKPRTILLLDSEKKKNNFFLFLGPVPFIRRMMAVSLIFLISFIVICLSNEINAANVTKGIFNSEDTQLLLVLMLFVTASGLGAAFSALFTANKYIVRGIFDPKYESSYWIRFILGIMAGLILSALIPIDINVSRALQNTSNTGADNTSDLLNHAKNAEAFSKPILAMLGGFSASLLYRVLSRIVETIESFVNGNPDKTINARYEIAKAKLAEETSLNSLKLNSKLAKLQSDIDETSEIGEIKDKINDLINDMLPFELTNHNSFIEEDEEQEKNVNTDK